MTKRQKQKEMNLFSEEYVVSQPEIEVLYFRSLFCLSLDIFIAFSSS